MNFPARTVDQGSVTSATDDSKALVDKIIRNAIDVIHDPQKVDRLAKGECVSCFYIRSSRVGGQAITTQPCGICGDDVQYSSTVTDRMCRKCAAKHELCKHCGADIKLRPRRKYPK